MHDRSCVKCGETFVPLGTDRPIESPVERSVGGFVEGTKEKVKEAPPSPRMAIYLCVSGWLSDSHDFERPWGIEPADLGLKERLIR